MKKLVFAGYFGFGNAGDEAILEATLGALRREIDASFDAAVVSGDPDFTLRRHAPFVPGTLTAISWRDPLALAEAVRASDLVVVGGGGLFHDYWGTDPDVFLTDLDFGCGFFAAPALVGALFEKPVMLYGVGVGPLSGAPARQLVAAAAESARRVTVRDEASAALLGELGIDRERVVVGADPVWGLDLPPPSPRGTGGGPRVAVALRPWSVGAHAPYWEREVSRALDAFLDAHGGSVTFVPFQTGGGERENDAAVGERVRAQSRRSGDMAVALPARAGEPFSSAELVELFDRHDLVVAMRMHGVAFAALRERPFVAIAYDPKVADAAQRLGATALPLADLTSERLHAALASAFADALPAIEARRERLTTLAAAARRLAQDAATVLAESGGAAAAAPRTPRERATAQGILALLRRQRGLVDDLASLRGHLEFSEGERAHAVAAAAAEIATLRGQLERAAARAAAAEEDAERWQNVSIAVQEELEGWKRASIASREEIEEWKRASIGAREELEEWKRVSIATRGEVEDWKLAHDRAIGTLDLTRGELARWRASRSFRAAERLWRLRRKVRSLLGRAPRPLAASAPPVATAAAPAADATPGERQPSQMSTAVAPRANASRIPRLPRAVHDTLVFSIIDWDFRFQRPQQLATQYARHGHRVFYLSTTAFLPPADAPYRLVDKAPGVVELQLRSRPLDIYAGRLDEDDVERLAASLDALAGELGIGDCVSIVEIPFWAPLARRLRERRGWRVVYDCMDEWTNFPGFGRDVLALEEGLVRDADVTVASADRLVEKLSARARRLVLAKNGVDGSHYRALYGPNELLAKNGRPVIGYYGALASWVDVPLLEKVARRFPHAELVLAGGRFDVDLSSLERLPNVRLLGQRPYDEMPRLLWHFDVCLIPFLVNDITEATNPVKFYEYLTSGKPVVAPALTELLPYRDLCYLAEPDAQGAAGAVDHERLLGELGRALAEPADDPRREARRRVARENDWTARYEAIDGATRAAHPLVSVVVVTFGGLALTKRCLASVLERETWPNLEVLVVDNASTDGTGAWLRELVSRDARVRVVLNECNLGFATANNIGLRQAKGDVLVLLNNDTVVPPGLLGRLVAHLERDRSIGLVCPTTNFCGNEAKVYADYPLDAAGLPASDEALAAASAARAARHRGESFDLAVAAMYCVALRRDALDTVGLLDEGYGAGMFEDDDFSRRMRVAGLRVVCAEDAYVHHVGQASFAKLGRDEYERIFVQNRAYFERKWKQPWLPHKTREGVEPPTPKV